MGKNIKMNTIKINIKDVVRKNLISESNKVNYLNESFKKIKDYKGDVLIEKYIETSVSLLNEGYEFEEIENYLNEIDNPLNALGDKVDWGGMFKESLYSSAKEYAIKFFLNYLGVNQGISTTLAQFFADVTPIDLLRPFKNAEYCNTYLPKIMKGVLEVIVRYLGSEITGTDRNDYNWSGMASVGLGNMFGEAISESNISNTISVKLCKIIH